MSVALSEMLARSVRLDGDIRLEYVQHGAVSGVPVILLHGITDSWGSFEGVLSRLPASLRSMAVSQRGHGDSSRPASRYRMVDLASDVAAFLDALEIPQAVIVGHSMGASVAQRFAIDFPDRVRGLVLMGASPAFARNEAILELWTSAVSTLADPVDPTFVRDFQLSTLAHPVSGAFLEAVVRESLKVPAAVWRSALAGLLEADFALELSRIAVPTLVAWGDLDAIVGWEEQETLVTGIRDARQIVYGGGGHAFHWEDPATFAADLASFTHSIAGRS